MSDCQIGPVFHVILRNETAICNCFTDVFAGHESGIEKRCLWEHCVKPYMKNFATSPYDHVFMTNVCLDAVLGWLRSFIQ